MSPPLRWRSRPVACVIEIQWNACDQVFAAAFLRDGEPWILDGALVGMGASRRLAVADLEGIARHLVVKGINFLLPSPLPLPDREWLFRVLDQGPSDDEMYAALRAVGGCA